MTFQFTFEPQFTFWWVCYSDSWSIYSSVLDLLTMVYITLKYYSPAIAITIPIDRQWLAFYYFFPQHFLRFSSRQTRTCEHLLSSIVGWGRKQSHLTLIVNSLLHISVNKTPATKRMCRSQETIVNFCLFLLFTMNKISFFLISWKKTKTFSSGRAGGPILYLLSAKEYWSVC